MTIEFSYWSYVIEQSVGCLAVASVVYNRKINVLYVFNFVIIEVMERGVMGWVENVMLMRDENCIQNLIRKYSNNVTNQLILMWIRR